MPITAFPLPLTAHHCYSYRVSMAHHLLQQYKQRTVNAGAVSMCIFVVFVVRSFSKARKPLLSTIDHQAHTINT